MRIKDILRTDVLVPSYLADIAWLIESAPGMGKSTMTFRIREILSEYFKEEFGLVHEHATTTDAPDWRGFLVPSKDKSGEPISFFTRPGVLPLKEYIEQHPRGIYVIEERGQAQLLTQNAVSPVVLEKRFGNHYLPKEWWVMSLTNRVEDRAGVTRTPMQLVNRETMITLDFCIESATQYWEDHGMHPMLVSFAKQQPGVFVDAVPKEPKPYCTARSYERTGKRLALVAGKNADGTVNMTIPAHPVLMELTAGDIGVGTSSLLFAYLKVAEHLPTLESIMRNPNEAKAPERLDAAYAAMQMCIHYVTPENVNKLWTYIERLPLELQTSAAKSFIERGKGTIVNSTAMAKWISRHKALVISSIS